MSTELERFRDYARERADWQPGDARQACKGRTPFGTSKPPDHRNCGGHHCGCSCHAPTDAQRALFAQLAGEIDAYLAGDPDVITRPTDDDQPLEGL